MWCTFNEQNMSKKECDTAWDYEMHLLYNIFQTESNVMVDSGKIIEYITKHFLPTPMLQMHFTSINKPVHLTKKLNKSKCTSEGSRWFLLNTTKCTCYCLIQPPPPTSTPWKFTKTQNKPTCASEGSDFFCYAWLISCCIIFNALSTPLYTYWLYYQSFLLCIFRLTFCAIRTR